MQAQTFEQLWKQEAAAEQKDLPQSQIAVLQQISKKAARENAYGQLLAASLKEASLQVVVSPDSLEPCVRRLVDDAKKVEAGNAALAAVYHTVLGHIFKNNDALGENSGEQAEAYYRKALANPAALAAVKASKFEPLLTKGSNAQIFGDDLLNVVAREVDDWGTLATYYNKVGNREAACYCSLQLIDNNRPKRSADARRAALDSLIARYQDLPVCAEVAIVRYRLIAADQHQQQYDYCTQAISKWGAWPRISYFKNQQTQLTTPQIAMNVPKNIMTVGTPQNIPVKVRNVASATLSVVRVNVPGNTELSPNEKNDLAVLRKNAVSSTRQTFKRTHSGCAAYDHTTDTLELPGLPAGVYLLELTTDEKGVEPIRQLYHVTGVCPIYEKLPDEKLRIVAVDYLTGQPIPGAKVQVTSRERYGVKPRQQTLTANNKGEVTLEESGTFQASQVYVYTDDDAASPSVGIWASYNYYEEDEEETQDEIFTDRAIYRPGQTLHVAVLRYQTEPGSTLKAKPVAGDEVELTLNDANHKEVVTKKAKTDEFGTASFDFELPADGLTGLYQLQTDECAYASVRVEEYKRPTFEVTIDEVKQAYAAGDTLTVSATARTYAGVPVQGATVQYKVNRRQALWWCWRGLDTEKPYAFDGTATTDGQGRFTMRVPLVIPDSADEEGRSSLLAARFYNFQVTADVTDQAGETRQGSCTIPLGTRATALSCSLPSKVRADQFPKVKFTRKNAGGQDIDGTVTYSVDRGAEQSVKANELFSLSALSFSSGKHTLQAICGADTLTQDFVVFSLQDKQPATETHDWFYQSAAEFPRDGSPVYVQIGSVDPDQHIVYTVFSGETLVESGAIDQSNAVNTRAFTYKETYRTGLTITYAWVKNGKLYTHVARIARPTPDRQLTMKWTTFRDRLTPGQDEQWTLSILRPDGKPARAQLMATLYDKSLDPIAPHQWKFSLEDGTNLPYAHWDGLNESASDYFRTSSKAIKLLDVPSLRFRQFDQSYYTYLLQRFAYQLARPMRVRGTAASADRMIIQMEADNSALDEVVVVGYGVKQKALTGSAAGMNVLYETAEIAAEPAVAPTEGMGDEGTGKSGDASAQFAMRTALQETAFFYPQLQTDGKGNVALKFRLPESVTTWRFMGLAHDAEMNYGLLSAEAVAQKTVMLSPNLPRFVRTGDEATLSARIFNTSEKQVSGKARVELLLAADLKEGVVWRSEASFTADASATASVSFTLPDTLSANLYIVRVFAAGADFSDGEQHFLPVLTNQEYITSTRPFTLRTAGEHHISTSDLFPQGTTERRLTVEYTSHPEWLALQALPYMSVPDGDNAISLATAYFANVLGRNILTSQPQIKKVIELWRTEKGNESSLASALEKNQELKTLVLSETPWVMEADREREQREALVRFFDENTLQNNLSTIVGKLQNLQNTDGSFSWWPGMDGSRHMTMAVVKTLTRLNSLTGISTQKNKTTTPNNTSATQQTADRLCRKAFNYLEKEVAKAVADMKKWEKKGNTEIFPSDFLCDYAYCSALAGRTASADVLYVVDKIERQKSVLSIYGKAATAVILHLYGRDKRALTHLESIKQYTVFKEEMGRYFDTPKANYSWCDYRMPSQVAAIEALKALTPNDKQTIEEMQRWLLQEKRTTMWATPVNSVEAVWAMVSEQGKVKSGEFSASASPMTLKADGKAVAVKPTSGLGYVKASLAPTTKALTIKKQDEGISWGAVYAQYLQNAAEVKAQSAGISVEREVIATDGQLGVGKRVKVRITIRAERDYDFVQVTDKRAACLEPVIQTSGYRDGAYVSPKDQQTNYFFDRLAKGTHTIETEYYIDRAGNYQSGTCTAQCAYAPEFMGRTGGESLIIK